MLYDLFIQLSNVQLFKYFSIRIFFIFYFSFYVSLILLKKLSYLLPRDRGKTLSFDGIKSKGKPTGAGIIFISVFTLSVIIFCSFNIDLFLSTILVFVSMLFGFLDDNSKSDWGEYRKALIDLLISISGGLILIYFNGIDLWIPFFKHFAVSNIFIKIIIYTTILWVSINTTNCSDGVDGLAAILVLLGVGCLSIMLYFVSGNINVSRYLLIPFIKNGANWAVMSCSLIGTLFAYLWLNAFPSKILMGDAGSRGIGFAIGIIILKIGNPFIYLIISTVLFINGGTGLMKVALKRFFKLNIFKNVRFPLHDHMKEHYNWSSTQIMIKYLIVQILIIFGFTIILFKIR